MNRIKVFAKKPWVLPVGVGFVGFVSGVLTREVWNHVRPAPEEPKPEQLQFDFTKPNLPDPTWSDEQEAAFAKIREEYKQAGREAVERRRLAYEDMVERYKRESVLPDHPANVVAEINVFEANEIDWDWELEERLRVDAGIYVLHRDEFFSDEEGWENQQTLTYYAGDDVLCDERDVPIYGGTRLIGELKFGHGSGDPDTFYVRNVNTQSEYEVIRNPGSYEDLIKGLVYEEEPATLEHSRGPGKFRWD